MENESDKKIMSSEYIFRPSDLQDLINKIDPKDRDAVNISIQALIHNNHRDKIFQIEVHAYIVGKDGEKILAYADAPARGCPRPPSC